MYRRIRVVLITFTTIAAAACLTLLGVDWRVKAVASPVKRTAEHVDPAQVALVLGAYVHPTGTPCPVLQDRLEQALELYRAGKVEKFLLSGDHGRSDYDEVNAMRVYLEKRGVPKELLYLDHAGFDTYDSLYRAKHIFQAESVVIVTQEFHLNRALYIGRSLGLKVQGVASDRRAIAEIRSLQAREYLANLKAVWEVHRKVASTITGPTIALCSTAAEHTHDDPEKV